MLLVGTICFEDRFCASKKGGMGRWAVFSMGPVHVAAALAGCRTALVGTGWTISHFISTIGCRNHSSPLVVAPFSGTVGNFQSRGAFTGWRALTIERLLISRCG